LPAPILTASLGLPHTRPRAGRAVLMYPGGAGTAPDTSVAGLTQARNSPETCAVAGKPRLSPALARGSRPRARPPTWPRLASSRTCRLTPPDHAGSRAPQNARICIAADMIAVQPAFTHIGGSLLSSQLSQVDSLQPSLGSEQSQGRESIMSQRQGTILKKCKCANQDRCSHKWTLRYWADGRQRELSFADELDGQGRPR